MTVETCKHCGAVILPEVVFPRSPIRQNILVLVRKRPGIDGPTILKRVWGKIADKRSINLVSVTITQMNNILRKEKQPFRIIGTAGRNGGYRVAKA